MSSSYNKKSPTVKRILREAAELASTPSTSYSAAPLDSNLFEWHFTLRGPPSTAYADGIYHGRITLPPTYPLRPPSFRFLTPSGRFEVNREICLSISGHHEETWQPAWGVRTAVVALRAFMAGEPEGQVGGIECSFQARSVLAKSSRTWKCGECGKSCEEMLKEVGESDNEEEELEVPQEMKLGYKNGPTQNEDADTQASGSTNGHAASPSVLQYQPARQAAAESNIPTAQHRIEDASPNTFWIDRLIYALVAVIFAILIKRILGIQFL